MRTLYFECNMGAAGDMIMAALLELHPDAYGFIERLNKLGIPDVEVVLTKVIKLGITGSQVLVKVRGTEEESHDVHYHGHSNGHSHGYEHSYEHDNNDEHEHSHEHEHHHHAGIEDIDKIIRGLAVSAKVKNDALAVYGLIAEAESRAHGKPVEDVHFHEVGTMDAIVDIVGVCMLIEELNPQIILASPIHIGGGHVRCAHGILPVPAPATAYILRDVPVYGGAIKGELCTPTGAAILKHFVSKFGVLPVMRISNIGYGMGKKDFEAANCVRAYLGETDKHEKEVVELRCNIDDMTPEGIGFALELLMEKGALDVYTTPIGMKKSRPGVLFTCICFRDQVDEMKSLILRHTTTLGIREIACKRYTLHREKSIIETKYGPITIKTATGGGFSKSKPEYEDIAKLARENGVSLNEIMDEIR
ncbi:MAG TPA: nickel pincer cofactor biosynthesis protein LarC [Clostridiales bacterium]|nr:nickel pincer cofactor biosynthesis protein LarC [Clostridiales bacterium]